MGGGGAEGPACHSNCWPILAVHLPSLHCNPALTSTDGHVWLWMPGQWHQLLVTVRHDWKWKHDTENVTKQKLWLWACYSYNNVTEQEWTNEFTVFVHLIYWPAYVQSLASKEASRGAKTHKPFWKIYSPTSSWQVTFSRKRFHLININIKPKFTHTTGPNAREGHSKIGTCKRESMFQHICDHWPWLCCTLFCGLWHEPGFHPTVSHKLTDFWENRTKKNVNWCLFPSTAVMRSWGVGSLR